MLYESEFKETKESKTKTYKQYVLEELTKRLDKLDTPTLCHILKTYMYAHEIIPICLAIDSYSVGG